MNLSRLETPQLQAPEIPDQVLFEGEREVEMGMLFTKFYEAFCSLQSCLWMETDVLGEWPLPKQMGAWEVQVTRTSHLGDTQVGIQVGLDHFKVLAMGGNAGSLQSDSKCLFSQW